MSPYRSVLCSVDFSELSRQALEWSLKFTKDIGAELTLAHVVDTRLTSIGNLVSVPDARRELRQRAEERIAAWKQELDLTRVRVSIVEGIPHEGIVAATKESTVDLLVMSTHGHSGFQRLLLGSVTEKVLHRVQVPLLSISAQTLSKEITAPKAILMAVDFGPEAGAVVRHGVWLAEHYGARLVAAHVVPVPYVVLNDRTVERLSSSQLEKLKQTLTADRRRELEALLPESLGVERMVATRVGGTFDSLAEMVREHAAELVVMGAGGHGKLGAGWLGSTCHKMVRFASCPVMIVR